MRQSSRDEARRAGSSTKSGTPWVDRNGAPEVDAAGFPGGDLDTLNGRVVGRTAHRHAR